VKIRVRGLLWVTIWALRPQIDLKYYIFSLLFFMNDSWLHTEYKIHRKTLAIKTIDRDIKTKKEYIKFIYFIYRTTQETFTSASPLYFHNLINAPRNLFHSQILIYNLSSSLPSRRSNSNHTPSSIFSCWHINKFFIVFISIRNKNCTPFLVILFWSNKWYYYSNLVQLYFSIVLSTSIELPHLKAGLSQARQH